MEKISLITVLIFFGLAILFGFLFKKFFFENLEFNKNFKFLSSGKYFYLKYLSLLLSFFIILSSIFGFSFGEKQIKNNEKGIDMMFVLDVSKSMNAYDMKDGRSLYSRLDSAKKAISDFVVNHKSDRFGLVIFAGDAISTVPLTSDHNIFLTFLENVDYRNLVKQGSDFEKALNLGIERFNGSDRGKALIFVSDGGDPEDSVNASEIEQIAKKVKGVKYFVAGIGTKSGGKIITGQDVFGRQNYQRFHGKDVVVKINEKNLKEISDAVDGKYLKISDVRDLSDLDESIEKIDKKALNENETGGKGDGSRILAFFSFAFFLIFLSLYFFENKIIYYKNKILTNE